MAFVGGTGILVFLDLIALMIRVNLGLIPEQEVPAIFNAKTQFKFVLYASFPTRKEAIGLDLIEGLRDINKLLSKNDTAFFNNFELILRIRNE